MAQQVQVLTVEVGTLVETESALGRELALSYVSAVIQSVGVDPAADERLRDV
ncbi:MAG: hypothetical protein JJE52_05080 [Acidimicrobiia bacterium]|nr:hypothetical protein [Acidimicrobiia bacterium]